MSLCESYKTKLDLHTLNVVLSLSDPFEEISMTLSLEDIELWLDIWVLEDKANEAQKNYSRNYKSWYGRNNEIKNEFNQLLQRI